MPGVHILPLALGEAIQETSALPSVSESLLYPSRWAGRAPPHSAPRSDRSVSHDRERDGQQKHGVGLSRSGTSRAQLTLVTGPAVWHLSHLGSCKSADLLELGGERQVSHPLVVSQDPRNFGSTAQGEME